MNPKNIPVFLLALLFFLALRVAWILYTGHTFEDAFITFRFAENVAAGNGFVHNVGERVYGTTTPLFTLLLALWGTVFPGTIVLGAWGYNLTASALSVVFLWLAFKSVDISREQRVITTLALAISSFLIQRETDGMEMSLVLCFMSLSFYALVTGKKILTGIALGLLLWTRIDGVFWAGFIILAEWLMARKFPFKTTLTIALTYLPWMLFAAVYFESPIPHTIIAKAFNYGKLPFAEALQVAISLIGWPIFVLGFVGTIAYPGRYWGRLFLAFFLFDILRIVVLNLTFEARYFVPLYWAGTILLSFGLYAIWNYLPKWIGVSVLLIYFMASILYALPAAYERQQYQQYVYSTSLKGMGLWLNQNTPEDSTVLLEPLGYVGYYANRHMLDEVALVTPQMIPVRRVNRNIYYAISFFGPDYVVSHCEYPKEETFGFFDQYKIAFETNPLNYDPFHPSGERQVRNSCYLIWERKAENYRSQKVNASR